MRGIFRGLVNLPGPKAWEARLLESKMVWYEVMVNRLHPEVDARGSAVREIRDFRRAHEAYFDRRFVYLICSRPIVRFSTVEKPVICAGDQTLAGCFEVGPRLEQARFSMGLPAVADAAGVVHPLVKVESAPERITLTFANGVGIVYSVHQFLRDWDINLGLHTWVHYVGFTENPDTRALDGEHSGLTRTLYRIRDKDRDVFVFYNTFGVTADADNPERDVQFMISNAMTDEVNIKDEGLILETALIHYFKPDCQGDQRWEEARLRNLLAKIDRDHQIKTVRVTMQFDETSEYFSFCSQAVPPSLLHTFQVPSVP